MADNIANPKGAFGDDSTVTRLTVEDRILRNVSTAFSIPVGCVVHYSTLTTDGTGVTKSTVINNVLTAGVAITSATTAGPTVVASSIAPAGSWLTVRVKGPAPVIVTTASSPGELIGSGNSTAFAGTTAGVAATITTGGTVGTKASLGRLLKASSDTNTTGQLGLVDVDISRFLVNSIST